MSVRVVRERIDPRLTAALFANYRTPIDALLALLDNAAPEGGVVVAASVAAAWTPTGSPDSSMRLGAAAERAGVTLVEG